MRRWFIAVALLSANAGSVPAQGAAPGSGDLGAWKIERGAYQCSLVHTEGAKFEVEVSDSLGTATLFAYRFVPGDFRERTAELVLEPSGSVVGSGLSAEWIYGGLVIFGVSTRALE